MSDFSSHSLRKTLPSANYAKTQSQEICRRLLGYANISATSSYLGIEDSDLILVTIKHHNLREDTLTNRYNKEYEQYYIYALEQFLIKTYGYTEKKKKMKVMGDFEEVKEDFENKEIK